MRQKLGGRGNWRDLGPGRAATTISIGGGAIDASGPGHAVGSRWEAASHTPRSREAARLVNLHGSLSGAATAMGVTRQRVAQLVRRG